MDNNETITQWRNGLRIKHKAHELAASHYSLWDRILGLVATLLNAVVATTIFASLSEAKSTTLIIIAGIISILATLVSAANSFLKYGELAGRHRKAVSEYGSLRRELETLLTDNTITSINNEKMHELNGKWSAIDENAPTISPKIYAKARTKDPVELRKE